MQQIHATAVAIGDDGVLLTGPSGSGKSDLALRLIEDGARLIADDRCDLTVADGRLRAAPPDALAGMLEVRGVGIVVLPHEHAGAIAMVCALTDTHCVERLPEAERTDINGVDLPLYRVFPFEASAPAKVRMALGLVSGRVASAV